MLRDQELKSCSNNLKLLATCNNEKTGNGPGYETMSCMDFLNVAQNNISSHSTKFVITACLLKILGAKGELPPA